MENSFWYCVQTKPKQEDSVAWKLNHLLHLDVLNPKLKIKKYIKQKLVSVEQGVFPTYIFSRLNLKEHFHLIRYTRGVKSFVGDSKGNPYIVDDYIVEFLSSKSKEGSFQSQPCSLRKGEKVEVSSGPFAGLRGVVWHKLKADERVMILLESLRHPMKVELPREFVKLEGH